jgi:hypothetical protein
MGKNVIISTLPNISQNYLPKVNTSNIFANSLVYDNGTNVMVNTTTANTDYTGARLVVSNTSNSYLEVRSTAGQSSIVLTTATSTTSNFPTVEIFNSANFGIVAYRPGVVSSNYVIYYALGSSTNRSLEFQTEGTARIFINQGGNVSIGSTNNTYKLDVNGTGNFTGALSGTSATFNVGSATTVLGLTGNGNGATIASITNTDTGSSARSSFQVTSDSATAHYFASSSTNVSSATGGRASTAGIFTASGDTAGGLAFLARNAAGVITFHTGGNTERVRIAANGETTFNNNVTLANGSDLVITPATSGVNATLYNDIGKLVSTASLVVQGTGEFTGALSGTSATFSSLSQNYIIKGGASGLLTSSGIIKEDGTKVEFLYSVSNSNQGVNLVNSNGSGYGNSINFYQSTTQTAQIFCESSVANTSEILFKTLVGGVLGTRFTIASTGAATFSSSVTLTSGQVRIEGSTAQAIYLYGAAGTKPYITLNEFGVRDWAISAGQSASGTLSITKTVGGTDGIIISGTGNVGIGTSSPNITGFTGTVLTINGTGNYQGLEIGTSGTARMTIVSDGTNGYVSTRQANMSLIFETGAASEKMRITSGGKVNINDTSNTTKQFSVINSSNSNSVAFFNNTVTNGRVLELRRKSGDTGDYFIVADNVTDNKFLVNGAGTIYAVNTTVQSVSDIAFKENIRDLELGLKHILDLKPRRFDWKEGKGLNEKNTIGFIAQEVEKSIPDIVKNDWKINMQDDKVYKSLGMTNMIPVLVKAIQELKAELDTLKNK